MKRTNRFTKPTAPLGWLYVVSHPNAPGQVKIGITERPVTRMQELGKPTILARVPVMKPRDKEQLLHNRFAPQRVPQTEYFQLDQQQLEFVLNACNSWMGEVQELIVEPQIPAGMKPDPHVVKAEPMPYYTTMEPGESWESFKERRDRRDAERQAEIEAAEQRITEREAAHREWLEEAGIKPPETKEEREQREIEEYRQWTGFVEDEISKRPEGLSDG